MDADGQVVQGLGRVLPVEVARRDYLPSIGEDNLERQQKLFAVSFLIVASYFYRVVCGAVHLCGDDPADKVDGVVADAVDLRAAPEGVGVLHAVAEAVALWN